MNRSEFIRILRRELSKLPQDEIDAAVEYYEEYFDEAGADREGEVIADLGTPKKIANQIKAEYAMRMLDEEPKSTAKKGLSAALWIIIGICSAPISLPLIIVLVALAVSGFAVAASIVIAVFAALISAIVGSVAALVLGILAIPVTLSTAVLLIGAGLLGLGIMAALTVAACIGLKKAVSSFVRAIRNQQERKKERKGVR